MYMDSKKTLLAINKLLLTNLLKFANLSQGQCSLTLSHHRNSLVGYIYRYDKKIFPRSFSYFFLLSIYRALAKKHKPKENLTRFDLFYNLILEHGGVIEKLLIPALEHHILSISSLNRGIKIGEGENVTINKNDIFDQDESVIIDKYISIVESEKYENYILSLRGFDCIENLTKNDKDELGEKKLKELKNFEIEINAIKNFYVICESLRKKFLPNFFSPSEYKKINFINDQESGFLIKKSAIRKNSKIKNFSNLFFFKANDDYMHPTISLGDDCLIETVVLNSKEDLKNNKEFESGLFLVNELKGLCIRRLQFSEFKDTFQIISLPDNKEYSRQTFPAFDNDGNPRVLGKVIWKSGFTTPKELSNLFNDTLNQEVDFEIPEFLRRNQNTTNEEIDYINQILNKKDLKLFEIDALVNKYRRSTYMKHINNHPKIRKILPDGLFEDEKSSILKKKRA